MRSRDRPSPMAVVALRLIEHVVFPRACATIPQCNVQSRKPIAV